MSRFKFTKRNGVTMIETLFAIFLVTVCAVILASSMPMATTARKKAELHNRAMALAQKEIEAIRGAGYPNVTAAQLTNYGLLDSSTPVATNTYTWHNVDSAGLDNPARILPSGQGYVVIEQPEADMRRVTVFVRWSVKSVTYEYRIGTLIANL